MARPKPEPVESPPNPWVLGLDPGFTGGWFVLDCYGRHQGSGVMPSKKSDLRASDLNPARLQSLLAPFGQPTLVALERVTPFAKGSRLAAFSFGRTFQCLIDLCELSGWDYRFVAPITWKKRILHDYPNPDKQAAMDFCASRFGVLTDHDGIADAGCLAEFARLVAFESD
jgi:hypothetical protein